MTFIEGVLARARGEVNRIRPRRDCRRIDNDVAVVDAPSVVVSSSPVTHATMDVSRPVVVSSSPVTHATIDVSMSSTDTSVESQATYRESPSQAPQKTPAAPRPAPLQQHARAFGHIQRAIAEQTSPASVTPAHTPDVPPARRATLPPLAAHRRKQRASTPVAPSIEIHIGRIEVGPPTRPTAVHTKVATKPSRAPMSLDAYLANRGKRS